MSFLQSDFFEIKNYPRPPSTQKFSLRQKPTHKFQVTETIKNPSESNKWEPVSNKSYNIILTKNQIVIENKPMNYYGIDKSNDGKSQSTFFSLNAFAGGIFSINKDLNHADLTIFGSGLPVISKEHGKLIKL